MPYKVNGQKIHTDEKDILKAQKRLQKLGSKIKLNGKMTIGMTTALYSFQRKHGLQVTGELDDSTWKELKKETSIWKKFFKRTK